MKLVPCISAFSHLLLVLILSDFTSGQDVDLIEIVDEDEYIPLGAHQLASQSLNMVNEYLGVESVFENVVVGGRQPKNVDSEAVEEMETVEEDEYIPLGAHIVNEYLGVDSIFEKVMVGGVKQDFQKPRNVETQDTDLDIVEEESYAPAEVLSIMAQTSQFLDDPYGLPSVFEDVWVAPRNEAGGNDSREPRNDDDWDDDWDNDWDNDWDRDLNGDWDDDDD